MEALFHAFLGGVLFFFACALVGVGVGLCRRQPRRKEKEPTVNHDGFTVIYCVLEEAEQIKRNFPTSWADNPEDNPELWLVTGFWLQWNVAFLESDWWKMVLLLDQAEDVLHLLLDKQGETDLGDCTNE